MSWLLSLWNKYFVTFDLRCHIAKVITFTLTSKRTFNTGPKWPRRWFVRDHSNRPSSAVRGLSVSKVSVASLGYVLGRFQHVSPTDHFSIYWNTMRPLSQSTRIPLQDSTVPRITRYSNRDPTVESRIVETREALNGVIGAWVGFDLKSKICATANRVWSPSLWLILFSR